MNITTLCYGIIIGVIEIFHTYQTFVIYNYIIRYLIEIVYLKFLTLPRTTDAVMYNNTRILKLGGRPQQFIAEILIITYLLLLIIQYYQINLYISFAASFLKIKLFDDLFSKNV
jgi:hypothetical protein